MNTTIHQQGGRQNEARVAGRDNISTTVFNQAASNGFQTLIDHLRELKDAIESAQEHGELPASDATVATAQVAAALEEAKKVHPDTAALDKYLSFVQMAVKGVATLAGLAAGIKAVLDTAQTMR